MDNDELQAEEEEELEPMSDEEYETLIAPVRAYHEAESTRLFGPPELRARKNQRYANRLVRRHTEEVIRGLLAALSALQEPSCAQALSNMDLASAPLIELIDPFVFGGVRFFVKARDPVTFEVEISQSFGLCGGGGRFLIVRRGDTFVVKETLEEWIN